MPASPATATKRLSPRCAASSASSNTASSSSRRTRTGQRTRSTTSLIVTAAARSGHEHDLELHAVGVVKERGVVAGSVCPLLRLVLDLQALGKRPPVRSSTSSRDDASKARWWSPTACRSCCAGDCAPRMPSETPTLRRRGTRSARPVRRGTPPRTRTRVARAALDRAAGCGQGRTRRCRRGASPPSASPDSGAERPALVRARS